MRILPVEDAQPASLRALEQDHSPRPVGDLKLGPCRSSIRRSFSDIWLKFRDIARQAHRSWLAAHYSPCCRRAAALPGGGNCGDQLLLALNVFILNDHRLRVDEQAIGTDIAFSYLFQEHIDINSDSRTKQKLGICVT